MRARLPWCGSLSAQVWLALLRLVLGVAVVMLPAALTGCALARPPRADAADHPQVVYVDRAVAVACLDARAMPAAPAPIGTQLSGEARHDAALLASVLLAERSARDRSMALLAACAK